MQQHPEQIAQISVTENTVMTRKELHLNSMRVASFMRSLGLKQSDVVGTIARNTTHISAVAYGCFFNGIAFHALNTAYDQSTIETHFNITKPRLIFCDGDEYEKVKSAAKDLNVKIVTMRNHQSGSISIQEVLATPIEADFQPVRLEQGNKQTLAILCSSGTTATPKAVTFTNSHKMINSCKVLRVDDVLFADSQLDWLSGITLTVAAGLISKRIITDGPIDAAALIRIIEEHKVTILNLTPSDMMLLVKSPDFQKANLHSIRACFYGGSHCSVEAQHCLRSRLKTDCLHMTYALTELGCTGCMNLHFDQKPNSAGRLMSGIKIKILNKEGKNLGPNEMGEICLYSGQYWAGYYGNPEETHNVLDSEKWFHTGDLGYMDDDGFLYIVDRIKDTLKYRNIVFYPNEIEELISKMPGVAEVCVFGIHNDLMDDEAAAAVVQKIGSDISAQDVIDYVKQNTTATYKHLNGGALIVDDIKRSPNGKTNRRATMAHFLEMKGNK